MFRSTHQRVLVSVGCGLLLTSTGCSAPTYPKERLLESVQEVLAAEGIQASVRLIDHTLAVQFAYPEALGRSGESAAIDLGPGFDEASRKALTALHRVLLSSDADVRFYLLLLSDPQVPGAYLTMVRYLEDIRKVHVSIISVTELMSRTVFELNTVEETPLTIEEYLPREIELSDFLTWQLSRRIRQELTDALQASGVVASVGRCQGQFREGEFAFALNVVPNAKEPFEEDAMQLVFDTATKLIAEVLSGYDFESFRTVRLIHPATGRNFVMPRAKLDFFR